MVEMGSLPVLKKIRIVEDGDEEEDDEEAEEEDRLAEEELEEEEEEEVRVFFRLETFHFIYLWIYFSFLCFFQLTCLRPFNDYNFIFILLSLL